MFLFTVGSVSRVKRFTTGSINSLKDVTKSQIMLEQERKWLRQQSKDFYAAGFDELVKRWDKCINVGGGYVEKQLFFFKFEYHTFYVLYPFVTYLLTLPRALHLLSYTGYCFVRVSPLYEYKYFRRSRLDGLRGNARKAHLFRKVLTVNKLYLAFSSGVHFITAPCSCGLRPQSMSDCCK
jgi:hypothetical protein